uniref:Hydrophobic seed protein domain-containing protein n=1 Tax=Salix viminalis TaxID=40686 RepID=A0A6N2KI96_SALVM
MLELIKPELILRATTMRAPSVKHRLFEFLYDYMQMGSKGSSPTIHACHPVVPYMLIGFARCSVSLEISCDAPDILIIKEKSVHIHASSTAQATSMASKKLIAINLILSLLFFSTFSSACATCPTDTLKLGACADILGLVNVVAGTPPYTKCCPLLGGLADGLPCVSALLSKLMCLELT